MDAFVYQSSLVCADCGEKTKAEIRQKSGEPIGLDLFNSDKWPQGPHADGGGEADYPQHCDQCNAFLENPLTEDGEKYVRDALSNPVTSVTACWADFYGIHPTGGDLG